MFPKRIIAMALAATMALAPIGGIASDAGHALLGGVVGGVIGGVIVNEANKNKPPRRTTNTVVVHPRAETATRAANRETQTALNYFGFNAGGADGVIGRRTRAAVSSMQAYMNMPVTGNLTPFERDILIGAYQRGIAGSYETVQLISKDPDGTRALLVAQRDIMTGGTTPRRTTGYAGLPVEVSEAVDEIAESSDPSADQLLQRSGFIQIADLNGDGNNDYILDTSFSGSSFWCNSVQCKTLVFVSTAQGYVRNDMLIADPTPASFSCAGPNCVLADTQVMASTPQAETTATNATGSLPLFSVPETTVSLDSLCSKVSLMTNANGGFTTAASMTDPNVVMNEQLCLARAYAIEDGERLVSALAGVTTAQVDAQCAPYGPALKDYVAALSLKPRSDVIGDVGGFVLDSGMDHAQLATTARICLSSGYRQSDMDIALGSALLLVALGETPYSELMGHHLSQGLGTAQRVDLSLAWYQDALDAQASGTPAVFAPDQPGRAALIQDAADMLAGGEPGFVKPVEASAKAKLPVFGTVDNFGKK